jgi:CubicO group peptidase (beta-lactamase class C family)
VVVAALALIVLGVAYLAWQVMLIGNGYVAKTVCSGVFVSSRKPQTVRDTDIEANGPGVLRLVVVLVDRSARTVTAHFLGLGHRVAVYRGPLGCTLAIGVDASELASRALPADTAPVSPERWTSGDGVASTSTPLAPEAVAAALEYAFTEPGPNPTRRTRAVVVVQGGRLVAERYASSFGRESALAGWSMSKTAVNALVGVLVRDGALALDAPLDAPEWRAPGDPRRAITLRQLLQMSSGLEFSESAGNPLSDVVRMLFGTADAAHFAAAKALAALPGARWSYSSGTTNIVARALRRAIGGSEADYLLFPRRALFGPLDMNTAILEPDAAGGLVGSSFMFASARDWARLGQLYLDDGIRRGRRVLPDGWVAFTTTPAPASAGAYGAHVWLRLPARFAPTGEAGVPRDAYHAVGHEGQFLTIVPSRRLVVVRLGLSVGVGAWDHAEFLRRLLGSR